MNDIQRQRFLTVVAQVDGEELRSACAQILARKEQQGETEFSPLAVLRQGQEEIYGNQLRAAEAAGLRCFDSDGDL